jgi:hypothetical protein
VGLAERGQKRIVAAKHERPSVPSPTSGISPAARRTPPNEAPRAMPAVSASQLSDWTVPGAEDGCRLKISGMMDACTPPDTPPPKSSTTRPVAPTGRMNARPSSTPIPTRQAASRRREARPTRRSRAASDPASWPSPNAVRPSRHPVAQDPAGSGRARRGRSAPSTGRRSRRAMRAGPSCRPAGPAAAGHCAALGAPGPTDAPEAVATPAWQRARPGH